MVELRQEGLSEYIGGCYDAGMSDEGSLGANHPRGLSERKVVSFPSNYLLNRKHKLHQDLASEKATISTTMARLCQIKNNKK